MANVSKTLKETEFLSLTPFAQKFYTSDEDGEVSMRYYYNRRPIGWNTTMEVKMGVERREDGQHYFSIDKRFDILKGVFLTAITPNIKVASKYQKTIRIRFTNNLFHHIHGYAMFSSGDGILQTITPKFLDDYRQTCVENISQYDKKIGNDPRLINWTNHLKPTVLKITPPWLFGVHNSSAFPLYEKCNNEKKIQLIYKFNLDISKLVQILGKEKGSEDKWKPYKFNYKYLEGSNLIESPEVWGIYSHLSKDELNFRKSSTTNTIIDYEDIIEVPAHDIKKYGQTISIPLSSSEPTFGISWKAQNQEALEHNDLSNYTTETFNLVKGSNPISFSEIKYGNVERVSRRNHYHFDQILPEIYFKKYPFEPGYNFYFFDDEPLYLKIGQTVVFDEIKNVTLNCTLGDTSEVVSEPNNKIKKLTENEEESYPDDDNDDSDKDLLPRFMITVILRIRKRIIFDKTKDKLFVIGDKLSYSNYFEK